MGPRQRRHGRCGSLYFFGDNYGKHDLSIVGNHCGKVITYAKIISSGNIVMGKICIYFSHNAQENRTDGYVGYYDYYGKTIIYTRLETRCYVYWGYIIIAYNSYC